MENIFIIMTITIIAIIAISIPCFKFAAKMDVKIAIKQKEQAEIERLRELENPKTSILSDLELFLLIIGFGIVYLTLLPILILALIF